MKKKTVLIILCLIVIAISVPLLIYVLNRDSKKVYLGENTNMTISRGEILVIEVKYCFTCGYSMWSPEYDKDIFELINTSNVDMTKDGLIGGSYMYTYEFRAKKEAVNSNIKLGYYRPWDAEDTWTVAKDLYITVK